MPDAMHITDIVIRLCRHQQAAPMADSAMRDGHGSALEFLVIEMTTDDGLTAASFGFAGRGARAAGEIAAASLKPFFLGRDPLAREKAWLDWRVADRWWHHVPIYAYGPFDVVCWLLAAEAAGQPLYQYIGEARDAVPAYVSSLVLADPEAYAAEALATRDAGFKAYKLHPPGRSLAEDMATSWAAIRTPISRWHGSFTAAGSTRSTSSTTPTTWSSSAGGSRDRSRCLRRGRCAAPRTSRIGSSARHPACRQWSSRTSARRRS